MRKNVLMFLITYLLFISIARLSAQWQYQIIYTGSDGLFGIDVGNGRNDGENRVYAVTAGNKCYELYWNKTQSQWNINQISITSGFDIKIAPARNDGVNRLYVTNSDELSTTCLYEYTWTGSAWSLTYTGTVASEVASYQLAISTGTKDNQWRIYFGDSIGNIREYYWTGSSWNSSIIGTVGTDRIPVGCCVAKGRNDGVYRVYTTDYDFFEDVSSVYEFTWTGSAWTRTTVASNISGMLGYMDSGCGRNDNIIRLYVGSSYGIMYEFSWTGNAWSYTQIGQQLTDNGFYKVTLGNIYGNSISIIGTTVMGKVYEYRWTGSSWLTIDLGVTTTDEMFLFSAIGDGRNEGKNRLYTGNSNGSIYEFNYYVSIVSYTISGYIRDNSSAAVSGIPVFIVGSVNKSTTTDSTGYWSFTGLPSGNYIVYPSSSIWIFSPSSYTYISLNQNYTNQNFLATPVPDTIPPAPITDLIVTSELSGVVILQWTNTGDDGTEGNLVNSIVKIKYSTNSADGWDAANEIVFTTSVVATARSVFTFYLSTGGLYYYFWLKLRDESNNWSEISNTAICYVKPFLSIPFKESWYTGLIDTTDRWVVLSGTPTVNTKAGSVSDDLFALELDGEGDEISSLSFDLRNSSNVYCLFWYHRGGVTGMPPQTGTKLQLYFYNNGLNMWQQAYSIEGNGERDDEFIPTTVVLSSSGYYSNNFRFKFKSSYTGNQDEDFYIDDIVLSTITYKISGYVKDIYNASVNGSVVKISSVKFDEEKQVVTQEGYYEFKCLYPDQYIIKVSSEGWNFAPSSYTIKFLLDNVENINFVGISDKHPPAGITDFVAVSTKPYSVNLSWTSTGDDFYTGDILDGVFYIKYSTSPTDKWNSVNTITLNKDVIISNSKYETFLELYPAGNTYYFWVRTQDDALNLSPLSNTATVYISNLFGNMVSTGVINEGATKYNNARRVVMDKNGTLYCAYSKYHFPSNAKQIFVSYSINNGKNWYDLIQQPIHEIPGYDQETPSLNIDSKGYLHCVWTGGDQKHPYPQIKYSYYDGTKWSQWENIAVVAGKYKQFSPCLIIDRNDRIHVIWYGGDGIYGQYTQVKYAYKPTLQSEWYYWINLSSQNYENNYSPTAVVDKYNDIHIFWVSNGRSIWYTKIQENTTYTLPRCLITSSIDEILHSPTAVIDTNNIIHIFYHTENSLKKEYRIIYSTFDVENIDEHIPNCIVTDKFPQFGSSPVVDKNNVVHLFWYGYTNSWNETSMRVKYIFQTGLTWSQQSLITHTLSKNISTRWISTNNFGGKIGFIWEYPEYKIICYEEISQVQLSTATERLYYIKGKVVNNDGIGIKDLLVKCESSDVSYISTTDIDGCYRFTRLKQNFYMVYISSSFPSMVNVVPQNYLYLPLDENKYEQNFVITKLGMLTGVVYGVRNLPIPNAIVTVKNSKSVVVKTVVTNEEGEFSIPLPEGLYTIIVTADTMELLPENIDIEIKHAQTLRLQIFLKKATVKLYGKVVKYTTGVPIENAEVMVLSDLNEGIFISTRTSFDGKFDFYNLPPKKYMLRVKKENYKLWELELDLTLGGEQEINVKLKELKEEIVEPVEQKIIIPNKVGEMKIFGGASYKGIVCPTLGEKIKVGFKGKSPGRYIISVYNLAGEKVFTQTQEFAEPEGVFEIFPESISSGVYVINLEGPEFRKYDKVVIIR